jgi:regulator of sigma E protease
MDMVTVRYGLFDGLRASVQRVWQASGLSLRLLGRLLTGGLSVKALSGPVAIADLAGKSAALGPAYFIGFMAFISVSLGVFNLLPIPVLDGGQLMYYLWEAATGKPVAGVWFERLQYLGVTLLLAMMAVATFNDIVSRMG